MFHIASAPLSALTHIIRRKVLQQYRWQMLIAAFTLKVWLPPPPTPIQNHLHAVYNTHITPLSKAVAWSLHEGTTSQICAVNKLDSYRSNQAPTASIGENTVFTNIVFTETAVFQLY